MEIKNLIMMTLKPLDDELHRLNYLGVHKQVDPIAKEIFLSKGIRDLSRKIAKDLIMYEKHLLEIITWDMHPSNFNNYFRASAALVLGSSNDMKYIPILLKRLETVIAKNDFELTISLITALAWLKAKEALGNLIAILLSNESIDYRAASAYALGVIGDLRALEPLYKTYSLGIPFLQEAIAFSLKKIGNDQVKNILKQSFIDSSEDTKDSIFKTIHILGQLAIPVLVSSLLSKDHRIIRDAAYYLSMIGDMYAVQPISQAINHNRLSFISKDLKNSLKNILNVNRSIIKDEL